MALLFKRSSHFSIVTPSRRVTAPRLPSKFSYSLESRKLIGIARSTETPKSPENVPVDDPNSRRMTPEQLLGADDIELTSESAKKRAEAEQLRAAEKFMVIGGGNAACKGCGYEYSSEKGDPDFPIPKGTQFQALPEDYVCPVCGAPKTSFESNLKVVAGFAQNQGYGFGGNSLTGGQKLGVIYGLLAALFGLLLSGYAMQ